MSFNQTRLISSPKFSMFNYLTDINEIENSLIETISGKGKIKNKFDHEILLYLGIFEDDNRICEFFMRNYTNEIYPVDYEKNVSRLIKLVESHVDFSSKYGKMVKDLMDKFKHWKLRSIKDMGLLR